MTYDKLAGERHIRETVGRSPTGSNEFVGRSAELSQLQAFLDDAEAGTGRLVLVAGEPGIGKTQFCAQVARLARERGFASLAGASYEQPVAPPCWPWMTALGGYVAQVDRARLTTEIGLNGGVLGELIPELPQLVPDLPPPVAFLDQQSARFRLFEATAAFLARAAATHPLLIVLDDLHWADEPSLQLLEFLSRGIMASRILVLGTYREVELRRHHSLWRTLAELTRAQLGERLLLPGLTRAEVGQVIEARIHRRPSPWLIDEVSARTEGNPLFVAEVLRLLAHDGELARLAAVPDPTRLTVRLPEGAREVIERRLDRLSDDINQLLRLGAVLGREFNLRQLLAVSPDTSEDRLLQLLEDALAAQIVEEARSSAGGFRFIHSLVQETLLDEISAARRVRLHARIAEALELLYGTDDERHVEELAYHFGEAEAVLGIDRMVRYSLRAGEQALSRYALLEALQHFDRVIEAKSGQAMYDDLAAAQFGKAQALAVHNIPRRVPERLQLLNACFDHYRSRGELERALAVAAISVADVYSCGTELDAGVMDLKEKALALAEPGSTEQARLILEYGMVRYFVTGDYAASQSLYEQALATARAARDAALELRLLAREAMLAFTAQVVLDGRSLEHVLALARQVNDPDAAMFVHLVAAWHVMYIDHEEARRHILLAMRAADAIHYRSFQGMTRFQLCRLSIDCGHWQQAADHISEPWRSMKASGYA